MPVKGQPRQGLFGRLQMRMPKQYNAKFPQQLYKVRPKMQGDKSKSAYPRCIWKQNLFNGLSVKRLRLFWKKSDLSELFFNYSIYPSENNQNYGASGPTHRLLGNGNLQKMFRFVDCRVRVSRVREKEGLQGMDTCKYIRNDITQEFISSLDKECPTRFYQKSQRLKCTKPKFIISLVGLFFCASPVSSKCLRKIKQTSIKVNDCACDLKKLPIKYHSFLQILKQVLGLKNGNPASPVLEDSPLPINLILDAYVVLFVDDILVVVPHASLRLHLHIQLRVAVHHAALFYKALEGTAFYGHSEGFVRQACETVQCHLSFGWEYFVRLLYFWGSCLVRKAKRSQ